MELNKIRFCIDYYRNQGRKKIAVRVEIICIIRGWHTRPTCTCERVEHVTSHSPSRHKLEKIIDARHYNAWAFINTPSAAAYPFWWTSHAQYSGASTINTIISVASAAWHVFFLPRAYILSNQLDCSTFSAIEINTSSLIWLEVHSR